MAGTISREDRDHDRHRTHAGTGRDLPVRAGLPEGLGEGLGSKDWEKGWGAFGVPVEPVAVFAACHDAQGRSEIRALTHREFGSYALSALEDFPHGGVPSYHVAGSLEDAVAHATGNLSALCTRISRQPEQAERFVRHYWFPLVEHQDSRVQVALQHVPGCTGSAAEEAATGAST